MPVIVPVCVGVLVVVSVLVPVCVFVFVLVTVSVSLSLSLPLYAFSLTVSPFYPYFYFSLLRSSLPFLLPFLTSPFPLLLCCTFPPAPSPCCSSWAVLPQARALHALKLRRVLGRLRSRESVRCNLARVGAGTTSRSGWLRELALASIERCCPRIAGRSCDRLDVQENVVFSIRAIQ